MATLAQLSAGNIRSESGRGTAALAMLLSGSNFLNYLERNDGWELDATNFSWTPTTATSTAPARALNANYSTSDRAFPSAQTGTQALHGDSVVTDRAYIRDVEAGLRARDTQMEKDIRKRLKDFGAAYETLLFNGSGSSNNIRGLKTILSGSDLPGYTGITRLKNAKDVASSGDSLDISAAAGQKKFIELLRTQLKEVDNPTGIILNASMWARIESAAYEARMIIPATNEFGQPILQFSGVELVLVNSATIALNEPDDNGTPVENTTSVYIMSPGEQRLCLVSNSGLEYYDWDHMDNAEKGREKWEIGAAWKIEDPNSILRIRNIKM